MGVSALTFKDGWGRTRTIDVISRWAIIATKLSTRPDLARCDDFVLIGRHGNGCRLRIDDDWAQYGAGYLFGGRWSAGAWRQRRRW